MYIIKSILQTIDKTYLFCWDKIIFLKGEIHMEKSTFDNPEFLKLLEDENFKEETLK